VAEGILGQQRYTLCGMPGQVGTERCDQETQNPDGDLSGLETVSEIHHCERAEVEVGGRKLG
jgi:hypothetical protein